MKIEAFFLSSPQPPPKEGEVGRDVIIDILMEIVGLQVGDWPL